MKVLHVKGKEFEEIKEPYIFYNGDVYLVDASKDEIHKVFVWLGSKCSVDERAVGAWASKAIDMKDESVDLTTEVQGQESEELKGIISFEVRDGGIPGFLKHVEVNAEDISYALYRVYDADISDGSSSDDIVVEFVPMSRSVFKSDDVYVLDAFHQIIVWIGKESQVGEKAAGNRLARHFDVDRARTPIVYTMHEGEEPPEFFKLIEDLAKSGEVRADDDQQLQEELTDVVVEAERSAPPPEVHERSANFVVIYFNEENRSFTENKPKSEPAATLEADVANNKAFLRFSASAGLVLRRTVERQARGICKTGYLLKNGARVGIEFELELTQEKKIDERLIQVGHEYR